VTYRLERIAPLTRYDPTDPAQRYTIHVSAIMKFPRLEGLAIR